MAILLQPAELGRIDLQIARAPDGSVRVTLTAERPDTARRLLADQPALHAALDRAGLSAERVVTVQTEPNGTMAGFGGNPSGGGPGNTPSGEHRPRPGSEPRQHAGTPNAPATQTIRTMTARAGIDITA